MSLVSEYTLLEQFRNTWEHLEYCRHCAWDLFGFQWSLPCNTACRTAPTHVITCRLNSMEYLIFVGIHFHCSVSHKMFCRALWQTTVENWEVELFQDQVLTGMESEGKRVKRVSPGEWDGGSEDGSKEPAKKRKKVAHSGEFIYIVSTGNNYVLPYSR